MSAAVKNYTGKQTPETAFQNVVLPIAEEAGYHFTWEDYQKYLQEEVKNLDLDEMDQVAGGDSTYGTTLTACFGIGIGAGVTTKINDDETDYNLRTICCGLGVGETTACAWSGVSTDNIKRMNPGWHDCTTSGA